jgi:nucleotide-binding universal stress UspA family protein
MKSILLYANEDLQLESRLAAALDVTRLFDGRLACVQATPFDSYIIGDPFGGIYALPSVVERLAKAESEHRASMEARLRAVGVRWSWTRCDGSPEQGIMSCAGLTDLIVLSLPDAQRLDHERSLELIGSVALSAGVPVLGIPPAATGFRGDGPALVAWNGSAEAVHALRLSLPLLARASRVHLVTVGASGLGISAEAAQDYLAEHSVASERHHLPVGDRDVAELLLELAERIDAAYVVLGAYGRSRFREAVLGGTTRRMLSHSPLPLVLAH